jgi:hypothetical protein
LNLKAQRITVIVGLAIIIPLIAAATSLAKPIQYAEGQGVEGSLSWLKEDDTGNPLGGATFEVCRTQNLVDGAFDNINPAVCITVEDDVAPDEDPDAGEFLITGLRLGKYTVQETEAPAGFEVDPDAVEVLLTPPSQSFSITEPFVNNIEDNGGRPILKITEFGYTNEPTGTPTSGVVDGTTAYTVKVKNFGDAAALMNVTLTGGIQGGVLSSGSIVYVGSTGPAGVSEPSQGTSCVAGCTATWNDISLAPAAEETFSVTLEYNQLPDGTVVQGDVTGEYKTDVAASTLTRTASGSPASILFTVQED